jgi:hypothetical protein
MQAQSVWNVWRRILREESLQQALFDPPDGKLQEDALLSVYGLRNDELTAACSYAEQADRAKWFVLNYRFRLANSFLNALEVGAPLVLRTLLNKGVDVNQLGCEFLDRHRWKDFGPYVYTYCAEALMFLECHEVSKEIKGFRDLIGLENIVITLMRDLSTLPPYPSAEAQLGLLRLSPYAYRYSSDHHLSPVLRNKNILGHIDFEKLPNHQQEHYLVYLPNPESLHKYVLLPQRAVEILAALADPCPCAQLPQRLEALGFVPHMEEDSLYIARLKSQRAVFGEGI